MFDYQAALKAGAKKEDILKYLANKHNYDYTKAISAGAKEDDVINFLASQPPQAAQTPVNQTEKPGFFKSLVTDPIKTLLVKPADRATEAVTRLFAPNSQAAKGYELMADEGQSRTFGGMEIEQQKAFGQGGFRQIVGDAAKAGSYLYAGPEAAGAVQTGLKGKVIQGSIQGAKTGAVGGGLYSFGNAIEDAENQASDVAFQTLFGATIGGATGGVLGGATPIVVKSAGAVRKFSNIEELNSELTKRNNITLKPTSKQQEEWSAQGVDPIKTYTEIFETKVPQVDKNNRFVKESVEDFVNQVDDVYRPGAEGFNTILRNSPEVNSLSKMEREALSAIDAESLTPVQRQQAKAKIQAEMMALKNEAAQSGHLMGDDNLPVYITDNFKDRFWANTRYFGDESTSVTNAANRAMGRVFAKNIEDVVTDVNVKNFNKQLQQYIVLKDFLASKSGALAGEGGKMTRLFTRGIGSVVGAKGGPVGSVMGALTGDKLAQLWINPANSPSRWLIMKQLGRLSPAERKTLEQEANEVIQRMFQKRVETLALPAGNPANIPILMRPASSIEKPAENIFNQSMVKNPRSKNKTKNNRSY